MISPHGHLLLIDDDEGLRTLIAESLEMAGHRVSQAGNGREAMELLARNVFHLVITDINLPEISGLEILAHIREHSPSTPVIIITAFGTVTQAVQAVRRGAFDFLPKPINLEQLGVTVRQALEKTTLNHAFDYLRRQQPYVFKLDQIIAQSPPMQQVINQVSRVAPVETTVILTGESGTGKSLIAGAIHANSPRAEYTLITVNCAALTETLLESELFGHEKGAFTGAHKARAGRIQQAHGGTLFLDEVGDMAPATQAKVLRALEEKVIQPVGGGRELQVDVRIVAATNRDLTRAVEEGGFREDLYYRLNVAPIHIPPLRERPEDIVPLAQMFLGKVLGELKRPPLTLSPEATAALREYTWPGNIRELRNVVERAVLFADGGTISPVELNLPGRSGRGRIFRDEDLNLVSLEKRAIMKALRKSDWIQRRAAKLLGITPRALVYKIDKYKIDHPKLAARRQKKNG